MAKIELSTVSNGNTLTAINENFQKIVNEFQNKVLYRNNPVNETNTMLSDLDMNQRHIFNLPIPVMFNEAARLKDVQDAIAGNATAALTEFTPYGSVTSENVQGAIQELADDIAAGAYTPEGVSVKSYGAIGDGVSDDTAAVQAAMNSGNSYIIFPKGTYKLNQIIIPSTVHKILGVGAGGSILVCSGALSAFSPWIYFDNVSGFEVAGLTIIQDKTVYALNHAFNLGACSYGVIHGNVFNETGFASVYMAGCESITVSDNVFLSFGNTAILSEVVGNRIRVTGNNVSGRGTGHAIAVSGGSHNEISNNFVNGAGIGNFGIAISSSDSIVSNNRIIANLLEGINLQDGSRVSIIDNIVLCEAGHIDFAISIYAANAPVEGCIVSGNRTYLSGSAGIGIASTNFVDAYCRYNLIENNLVVNPCRSGAVPALGRGGINLYGPQTQANTVKANTCADEGSNMFYGVNEWNDSLGPPDTNYLIDNNVSKSSALIEVQHRLTNLTKCYDLELIRTNTLMSATSGALGGATSSFAYQRRGNFAHVVFGVTITNNGTASGSLVSSLPFTSVAGSLVGRESGGAMCVGRASAGSMIITAYNNTYPATTGTYIELSGTFEIL